jgi:hypothetical protein
MKTMFKPFILIISLMLIISCGIFSPKTTKTPVLPETSEPTATSTPVPTHPPTTRTSVPTITSIPYPTLPSYYIKNRGLVWISPATFYEFKWIDNDRFLLGKRDQTSITWEEYQIPLDGSEITFNKTPIIEPNQKPCDWPVEVDKRGEYYQIPDSIYGYIWEDSPNCEFAMAINTTLKPITKGIFGVRNIAPLEGVYFEVWIIDRASGKSKPIFHTPEEFSYFWVNGFRYLLASTACYGGGENYSQGSFLIDTQELKLYWLGDYNLGCEGGAGPRVSPNSKYIVFQNEGGTVETIFGTHKNQVCPPNMIAHSYSWTSDSKYLFVACGLPDEFNVLYRYDPATGENTLLTDPDRVRFKTNDFVISPDQNHILFQWGNYYGYGDDNYGIWLLDINKANQ